MLPRMRSLLAYPTLVFILLAAFGLMMSAAFHDTAIVDELAHIPAGYSYIAKLDGRLNPEHPPLLKMIAELPVFVFLRPHFPDTNPAWSEVNGQWTMGTKFIYESENDANALIRLSRVGPILLTLLLILLTYIWSARLFGKLWGLLPASLVAFSPTILAHGHYVTTDVAAAFGFLSATFFFVRYLEQPTPKKLILAGIFFGIAQALKFSAVLLVPILLLLGIIHAFVHIPIGTRRFSHILKRIFFVGAIFAIGYIAIILPLYTVLTINYPQEKQIADTQFLLGSFSGGPTPPGTLCALPRCPAELTRWMTEHTLTRPFAEYLLGVLMVLQRSSGGNTRYFLGEVSAAGTPLYFPLVYLFKEPLPILFIIVSGFFFGLWNTARRLMETLRAKTGGVFSYISIFISSHFQEFAMIFIVALYWLWSMMSPLNIGVRHLIPTLPFMAILATAAWKKFNGMRFLVRYGLLTVLVFWLFLTTAFASPYFLSYFNFVSGGTQEGYRKVTDSNYDWGQDLLELQAFLKVHPEIQKIAVDYFGGGHVWYYLHNRAELWQSNQGNPKDRGIEWFAVSVNTLSGAFGKPAPGFVRRPEDEYRWLKEEERREKKEERRIPTPDYRVGTSIFIYKL